MDKIKNRMEGTEERTSYPEDRKIEIEIELPIINNTEKVDLKQN